MRVAGTVIITVTVAVHINNSKVIQQILIVMAVETLLLAIITIILQVLEVISTVKIAVIIDYLVMKEFSNNNINRLLITFSKSKEVVMEMLTLIIRKKCIRVIQFHNKLKKNKQ